MISYRNVMQSTLLAAAVDARRLRLDVVDDGLRHDEHEKPVDRFRKRFRRLRPGARARSIRHLTNPPTC